MSSQRARRRLGHSTSNFNKLANISTQSRTSLKKSNSSRQKRKSVRLCVYICVCVRSLWCNRYDVTCGVCVHNRLHGSATPATTLSSCWTRAKVRSWRHTRVRTNATRRKRRQQRRPSRRAVCRATHRSKCRRRRRPHRRLPHRACSPPHPRANRTCRRCATTMTAATTFSAHTNHRAAQRAIDARPATIPLPSGDPSRAWCAHRSRVPSRRSHAMSPPTRCTRCASPVVWSAAWITSHRNSSPRSSLASTTSITIASLSLTRALTTSTTAATCVVLSVR